MVVSRQCVLLYEGYMTVNYITLPMLQNSLIFLYHILKPTKEFITASIWPPPALGKVGLLCKFITKVLQLNYIS
jgi:hypothetical protein